MRDEVTGMAGVLGVRQAFAAGACRCMAATSLAGTAACPAGGAWAGALPPYSYSIAAWRFFTLNLTLNNKVGVQLKWRAGHALPPCPLYSTPPPPLPQKLRTGLSDIVCLDGTRISGRGIVSGSNWQPPPLDRTDICFGATPHGQVRAPQRVVFKMGGQVMRA